MRCEVVAIGTELLLGQIVDTNSSWMGEQLALAGIDSHFQTKVGDNQDRIVGCIRLALERADAVILCGGLGPTQDDITREAIAEIMGVRLIRDHAMGERIRALFESRGRHMTANNLRQADVPEGAWAIPEMPGTAPGLVCPLGDKVIYAVPGVPYEMRMMLSGTVLPDLQRRAGVSAVIRSRVLRTWGQTESGLAEMLAERITELDELGNPTIAFQASGIEGLKVRLTAKAADQDAANAILAEEEARARAILGDFVFGVDDQTMESAVIDGLRTRGLTLAIAETLTGGLMGARIAALPDPSDVYRGGSILFSNDTHRHLSEGQGTETPSEAKAAALAKAIRERMSSDVGLASVGVAGPDEVDGLAVGTVFLGLATDDLVTSERVHLPGDANRVRQYSVISLLNLLRRRLLAETPSGTARL
ncbi:MAG: CinA family nicotinamide mononucleotide deamidase-related protein [Pseudomonadota bacterium]